MAKIDLKDLSNRIKALSVDNVKTAMDVATVKWGVVVVEETKKIIVETIKRGQSPVEGGRGQTGESSRFVEYSPSYQELISLAALGKQQNKARNKLKGRDLALHDAILKRTSNTIDQFPKGKRLRPVNLTLWGTMLRSIKGKATPTGFSIWFTSPIAKYHTIMGAGRSQVKRKMLPVESGDKFTRLIMKGLVDKFRSILLDNLKKG